jgi:hypothetical protein
MANKQIPAIGRSVYKLLVDLFNGSHAEVVSSLEGAVVASDGNVIHPPSLDQALAYDQDTGNLVKTTVTSPAGVNYSQTLTWTGGKLTAISKWVKQP